MSIIAIDPGSAESDRKARHKAALDRAQKKYRAAHRELLNERQRIARKAEPEKQARRMREYRARRPEVIAAIEARRIRPQGFREKFNTYRAEWAKANPDKISEYAHRRGETKMGRLPSGTIKAIGERQRWRCAVCAGDLKKTGHHKDHILPLALGGSHDPGNIQLLCPPCNLSKGARHPVEFMQSKGKLL